MQIAYRANDLAEAHIVAGLLRARGIEAHVGGHFLQGAIGEIGASGFTNVHVDDDDYQQAREIVEEYERTVPRVARRARASQKVDRYARGFLAILLLIVLALVLAVNW